MSASRALQQLVLLRLSLGHGMNAPGIKYSWSLFALSLIAGTQQSCTHVLPGLWSARASPQRTTTPVSSALTTRTHTLTASDRSLCSLVTEVWLSVLQGTGRVVGTVKMALQWLKMLLQLQSCTLLVHAPMLCPAWH